MPSISRHALVPYTPKEMFDLVNDVAAYPRFLPGCRGSAVLSANEDEVRASIELAKGAVRKSFTTCNRLQRNKMIEMRLVEGPFRHLEGFWRFDAMSDTASRVSLDLEFEFSNRLMSMAFGPVFHQVANTLVDSFVKRAREVYGVR
ncbi:Ribosome association toxin PasT (RatA) of the RatAB toxin-antitoxin module [Ectothiorhodospira magna]|uniref:Ribosome association toxin PasT (RatA) of the RatAB toxin-antitoxin module n=1 Tax=Ectothiorhodospira magna TaxID=867345 RepID=A0A1H9B1E1_9GAMM|nr:type II toxin-antitoxin system RatA family toxin [Ectothiorhodospira magna]SEP82645.1 Ribosome association toxin PasT (RatA) of the RatAB toxin-antitoxin module [Ectothiorhodospira magna]